MIVVELVVVVVGAWVVVVVVGAWVVVVVAGGVIERPQPIALQTCGPQIELVLVSTRLLIASPIEAGVAAATALKVTMATLTTPVGMLPAWNAAILVSQLLAVGQTVWAIGAPWNPVLVPPEIEGVHVSPLGQSVSTVQAIVVVVSQLPGTLTTVGS